MYITREDTEQKIARLRSERITLAGYLKNQAMLIHNEDEILSSLFLANANSLHMIDVHLVSLQLALDHMPPSPIRGN